MPDYFQVTVTDASDVRVLQQDGSWLTLTTRGSDKATWAVIATEHSLRIHNSDGVELLKEKRMPSSWMQFATEPMDRYLVNKPEVKNGD